MKLGSNNIAAIKLGSNAVSKMYKGTDLVFGGSGGGGGGGGGTPGLVNWALAANGGTATATNSYSDDYLPSQAINGSRIAPGWGTSTNGGWNSADQALPKDFILEFPVVRNIKKLNIFSLQDIPTSATEPTPDMTFSSYGIKQLNVFVWVGGDWAFTGSLDDFLVWKVFDFEARGWVGGFNTTKIKLQITNVNGLGYEYSRLVEVEALGDLGSGTPFGTLSSGATWSNDAPFSLGKSVAFDGTINAKILTTVFSLPEGYSISLNFKTSVWNGYKMLFGKTGNAGSYLGLDGGEYMVLNAAGTFAFSSHALNTWHNLVINRVGGGAVRAYLNNVESYFGSQGGGSGFLIDLLGAFESGNNLTGNISDVRVFNLNLDATARAALAAGNSPATASIIRLKLNEGVGITINDTIT